MPIEYNLLGHSRSENSRSKGYVGYCSPEFWDIAREYGNRCIIGVDAHSPQQLDCADVIFDIRRKLEARGHEVIDAPDGIIL